MKLRQVTACVAVLLGATIAAGQSNPVRINLDELPPPKKPDAKPVPPATSPTPPPATPPAAAPKKPAPKKDEMGTIDGLTIPRGEGFLGLQIVNETFKLSFYDAKKKLVAPDVARAMLRWKVAYQKGPETTILTASGNALGSDKTVREPYHFKLFITLLKDAGAGDGSEANGAGAESFVVDFAQ